MRGETRSPPFLSSKGHTAADNREGRSQNVMEGVAGCSPERMVGTTVLFLCLQMKGRCLDEPFFLMTNGSSLKIQKKTPRNTRFQGLSLEVVSFPLREEGLE